MPVRNMDVKNEDDLKDLLFNNPESIELGLKFIKREALAHGQRRIDLLGSDKNGRLVVAEAKLYGSGDLLPQILDYADFAYKHFRILKERHPDLELKSDFNPSTDIRLVVIAAEFDDVFLRIINHVKPDIEVYRFQSFEMGEGIRGVTNIRAYVPQMLLHSEQDTPTEEKHIDYIADEKARNAAKAVADWFRKLEGVQVVPTQTYLGFKVKRGFAAIYSTRAYFHVWFRIVNDEYSVTLNSIDDFNDELKESLLAAHKSAS